jgi:hypothetical protein
MKLEADCPCGHTASHSPWFVQEPKPASSMAATMARTRAVRSGCPWGRRPRWRPWPRVKSMAEALGRRPRRRRSRCTPPRPWPGRALLGDADRVPSGRRRWARDEAPGGDDPIEGAAVDDEVLDDGKALARQGSIVIVSPSSKLRMWSWQAWWTAADRGPRR